MNTCTACTSRPVTDATVCTPCADELARALGDVTALVTRPCIHTWPTDQDVARGARAGRCLTCGRTPLARDQHGSLPSSVFDLPSGAAIVGDRRRDLGRQLDVARAHQAALTRPESIRSKSSNKPGARVYAPRTRLDRAQASLHGALTIWANVVEAERHDLPSARRRPRPAPGDGAGLGDLAGWLLGHVEWIRHHHDAAAAVAQVTAAVSAVEAAVDRGAEQVYVGPCWQPDPDAPSGECTADLYAERHQPATRCPRCGYEHQVAARREWLQEHMSDVLATATEVSRIAAIVGLTVTADLIRQWKGRDKIAPHGHRQVGSRQHPLYRVGDVLRLAGQVPDTRSRTA